MDRRFHRGFTAAEKTELWEASNHTPSLADFTTTTPELKFSVHATALRLRRTMRFDTVIMSRLSIIMVKTRLR
jgi:hypothetical protein